VKTLYTSDKDNVIQLSIPHYLILLVVLGLFMLMHRNQLKLDHYSVIHIMDVTKLKNLHQISNLFNIGLDEFGVDRDFINTYIQPLITNNSSTELADLAYRNFIQKLITIKEEDSFCLAKELFSKISSKDIQNKIRDNLYYESGSLFLSLTKKDPSSSNYDKYLQIALADLMHAKCEESRKCLNKILSEHSGCNFDQEQNMDLSKFINPESIPELLILLHKIRSLQEENDRLKAMQQCHPTPMTFSALNSDIIMVDKKNASNRVTGLNIE
jgi:hypothetical protein